MLLDHKYQNDFVNNTVGIVVDKSKINIVSDETNDIKLFGSLNYSQVVDKTARYVLLTFAGIQEYPNLSPKSQRLLADLICNYIKIDSNWFTFKQTEYANNLE